MALVHRTYSGRRENKFSNNTNEPPQQVSPLVILQARFQQKQLQEKEEKLLRLYEEQQERALKSVGSLSQSGGSSVSSTSSVGVGKVRHMFQSRRGNSESRLGVGITGRDKSYPLEPLTKYPSSRNLDHDNNRFTRNSNWKTTPHQRSTSLDRHNSDLSHRKNEYYYQDLDENFNYSAGTQTKKTGVRRTQSQARTQKPKANVLYFGGSHADLQFSDELDYGQSFQVVDDHYERRDTGYQKVKSHYEDNTYDDADDYFMNNFNNKINFYENRLKSEQNNNNTVPGRSNKKLTGLSNSQTNLNNMEGRYKSYVSQSTFSKKPHLGNGTTLSGRSGLPTRQVVTEVRETTTHSSGYLNGSVSSPVRKIRKPTPVPLSVTPPQHIIQKDVRKTTRTESIREVPSAVPSTRTPASRTQSTTGTLQKPPTSGRSVPSTRISPAKSTPPSSSAKTNTPSDLVNCRICGRHFAADRVSKHEEVCQKSSKSKRKPFDAVQQRVKGTEVENYFKKSKPSRIQQDKQVKPQTNWRKKHEEFIANIRAAKEVSAHLKKGGKLSDLPPPPPSDYSDYIQCPHCSRKFNSSAAERHIPKCANIINNKPKPNVQKKAGLKTTTTGSKLLHSTSPSARGRK